MPLDLMTLSFLDRPVTKREGLEILKRDQYRCQYCGLDGSASFENALAMSVDFVIPRARKGKKNPSNLVACCRPCNMIKGTRTYRSFDDAKQYVLKRREELRRAWATRQRPTQSAKAEAESAAKPQGDKSGSVISSSPLSLRR
jgi:5-methylcytosine-specific restriction endonuclease McrA